MRDMAECFKRRYKALDELIKELGTYGTSDLNLDSSSNDPEIKLMCEFWNILKDDPGVNLQQAVQQRMGLNAISSGLFEQNVDLYMAGCCKKDKDKKEKEETVNKIKNLCCKGSKESSHSNAPSKIIAPKTSTTNTLPLNKALCNLKEAASFEKKCTEKVNELLENQKQLQNQIVILELREKDGMQLLKKADCMWSCMEESYKRKIAESLERQQGLLTQLKEVEASNKKWRNNKKDLEFEMDGIIKCHQEIIEQINHKTNDVKCIDLEISNFQNRIESDKKDIEVSLKSLSNKKQASDVKMATMAKDITKLEKLLIEEHKYKDAKEQEGRKYVKDAREDLQHICKILLQKKLEIEDMKAEREALILEFEMLKQTCDQCREKCKNKQETIIDEIKTIEKDIADFRLRCIRCHECTDTIDVRRFCTDCPRCVNEQDCLLEEGYCSPDHATDCVCMTIKQKFLDNVFDNMYTLLERQVHSGQGKEVAEAVMNCLKKSRNGKINDETKKILQEFILTTVKKNLKLTIVGGAVKTRCEMDPETYKQLMVCLNEVKVTKPERVDKGTDSKKPPCKHWGGSNECNCPKGPQSCACIGKGIQPSTEAQTCPPQVEDKEDVGEKIICPHRDNAPCGEDCAAHGSVGSEVASWRPNPCQGPTCIFKNMRAAQCILGPEVLSTVSGPGCISPFVTSSPILEKQAVCKCSGVATVSCVCHKDLRSKPRERIIQEVMGKYTDVTPIEKVVSMDGNIRKSNEERNLINGRVSEISPSKQNNLPNMSYKSYLQINSTDNKNNIEYKTRNCKKNYQSVKHICNNRRKASNKNAFKRNKKSKLSREINVIRDESNKDIVTNNLHKYKIEDNHENICNEVNNLMRDVIILDDDVKLNVEHEWISLTSFINEVTNLTQITSDESHVTIQEEQLNEILCTTESLEQDNISVLIDNEFKIIYINEKYSNEWNYFDSKQLKAGIADVCDKNKCETNVKSVNSMENIQDENKHIAFYNMLVPQNNKDLPTKELKVVYDEKIKLTDTTKTLKTSSGDLKVALNQKLLKMLKDTNASEDIVDRSDLTADLTAAETKTSDKKHKVLAKKTQPGNILLDKSLLNNQEVSTIKLSPVTYNPTKDNKKDCTTPSEILNVKVIGAHCNEQEPLFALKATNSGNYEIVLDKEFEKWYKQTVKNYQGEDDNQFTPLTKTGSGNFVIDLENHNIKHNTSALMVKSESGNIKVIMNAGESESSRKNSRSKSVISPRTFNDLLNKLPISSTQFHKENIKKSRLRSERSSSDSHVYGKTKFNFKNEYNFPSKQTSVVQKTCTGEYAVILNKDSKKSFINNLKSYLTISSKGLVPIKRTNSDNIYIDLSKNANNLSNYGSVKITPSGNIYITIDEQGAVPLNIINTSNQNNEITANHQLFSIKKSSSPCLELTTTCSPRDINSTSECNLMKLPFKSKNCLLEQSKDESSETHPCGQKSLNTRKYLKPSPGKGNEHKKNKSKCMNNLDNSIMENKSPHIVIKPCGCRPILENSSTENCYCFIQSICPFHIDRYEKVSNDLLEISGLCSGSKSISDANHIQNTKGNNLLHVENKIKKSPLEWDSLQYLPAQLPSFLRDYN